LCSRRGGYKKGYKKTDCDSSCQVSIASVFFAVVLLAFNHFMEIRTLENTPVAVIASTFNEAFQ
jgi:ABC-type thiamin/hydroxymethylpyrimidine transport system permease subunit